MLLVAFGRHATSILYQWREISGVPLERRQPPFPNATNKLFPTSVSLIMHALLGKLI
jgi:hypothetical protein